MAASLEVPPERLRRRLDPDSLPFQTTEEVAPLEGTVGQPRALDAIAFGLEIDSFGYNLFLAGPSGSGRESTVREHLARVAPERPTPGDWVYVHNFRDPDRPRAIGLPPGRGRQLARDMEELVEAAREEIPRAFESEDYARVREEAVSEQASRSEELTRAMQDFASERGFGIQQTPAGIVAVPLADGRPVPPPELQRLPDEERRELERRGEEVQERVETTLRELNRLQKSAAERTTELTRNVALFALGPRLDALRERYADEPEVLAYLDQVRDDIPDHVPDFRPAREHQDQPDPMGRMQESQREEHLARYAVNVLVDNSEATGAPVVVERNPTFYNLVGRLDYRPMLGTLVTGVRQLKAGALQRANGGFLILDALELLLQPFAWYALKRALRAREARIENLAEQLSPVPTATLRPEPIPLDLKLVLIGPPPLYQLLCALDPDFRELFKVKADFAPEMDWSDEHLAGYAGFLRTRVERDSLRHFHRSAVARVAEHGARLRDDQRKLTARLLDVADLAAEASFFAGKAGREHVRAEDVEQAITRREYRSNLLEERVHELIRDGTVMIDTDGGVAGQVNGLALVDVGDHAFGRPSRVTARVAVGPGTIDSIERQIELSDPIHSKGVLTLAGYLAQRYGQERPLALRATLTLEQSYDEIGGDSASAAELYALLSALAEVPIRQGIAVTGSVNQHGELQAVGAVTRKIEGFFAVCRAKGLTGGQGVVLPQANVRHLMLSGEVVQAVQRGDFHVWAASSVDEGMELLTGRPAEELDRLVAERLHVFAERLQAFGAAADGQVRERALK